MHAGHVTMPHVHHQAHELFFVLSGRGTAFCDGTQFPIVPGDCIVFPPGVVHGVNADEKLYCLELMLPNENFAELVRNGMETGYDQDDSCVLAAIGC
jgi:mannose-6-phosphate isomerase-like protein (cupin superfamily)